MKFTLVSQQSMAAYSTLLKTLSFANGRFCCSSSSSTVAKRVNQSLGHLSTVESGQPLQQWALLSTSSLGGARQPLNYSNDNGKGKQQETAKRDPSLKPTNEQLIAIKERLTAHLPRFLLETHPYVLYTPDVVFENFYKEPGKVTVGALQYAMQLTALRWKIHWKFSAAQIQILKITHHDTDGTIKIRWRVAGIRGAKTFIQPWKIKFWKMKQSVATEAEWHDGFSILYVRGDGLIYKHRMDKIMPQQDQEAQDDKKKKLVANLNISSPV